ncbi:binding-protein-dependent transport systems inner membrane component [Coprobacillus sp. CAG:826]|jgi:multiple sugar transport system permease protein|nr:binding-protein-dependent transport systems inner membrane component [Coprobacillus sp. CAG:826]
MKKQKTINGAIVVPKKRNYAYWIFKVLSYLCLIAFGVIIIIPFLMAIITSLTPQNFIMENGFKWSTGVIDLEYYIKLLTTNEYGNIYQCFLNTILYIAPPIIVGTFCSALSAYAFARINFKGKKVVFYLLLSTMVIPGIITTFSSYLLFVDIYKVNDWFPLFPIIVPGMFGAVGTMFFLKQYFETLPKDLEEAAEMDGMSRFGMFIKVILPLSVPAIITQLLLGFNGAYNDYLGPLLYIGGKPSLFTMQLYVNGLSTSRNVSYPLLMSGALLALLPTLVLYLSGQKFFVEGIVMTGIK